MAKTMRISGEGQPAGSGAASSDAAASPSASVGARASAARYVRTTACVRDKLAHTRAMVVLTIRAAGSLPSAALLPVSAARAARGSAVEAEPAEPPLESVLEALEPVLAALPGCCSWMRAQCGQVLFVCPTAPQQPQCSTRVAPAPATRTESSRPMSESIMTAGWRCGTANDG